MKTLFTKTTKAIFLLVLLAATWQAGAQAPEKFNYQLAVRDAQGNVYASQQVSFRVSIMQGSTVLYQETHTTQTNAYGLVNLMIGDGTSAQGSMAAIDWGGEAKSLKVEIDPAGGSSYTDLATTPLLSVPYALFAKHSGDSGSETPIGGENYHVQFNNNGALGGSANFVFNHFFNRVGIGTSTPEAPLHVQTNGEMSIFGIATASSGNTYGGYFLNYSSSGIGVMGSSEFIGVRGVANAFSEAAYGGHFQSASSNGRGVYGAAPFIGVQGAATATSGVANGGHFQNSSNEGSGVLGFSSGNSGNTFGGYFVSNSSEGKGVYGTAPFIGVQGAATATSGVANGGHFQNSSNEGSGVLGFSSGNSGNTFGGYFVSNSSEGKGVFGTAPFTGVQGAATAISGNNSGGHFVSNSSEGRGVYGTAPFTGVQGAATATSGNNSGGHFASNSSEGKGVYGTAPFTGVQGAATATSGLNYGGHFTCNSTEGTGIYAIANAGSGTTYGVRSYIYSSQGFSGYFSGGKFFISGNTGIGTFTPEAGLHLKGAGFPNTFMYLQSNVGQDAGFRIYEGTNVKWSIFNQSSSGGLNIYNNDGNTAIFAKQSNAFVGIGNNTPTQALDVNGNARFRAIGSVAYSGVVNRTSDGTLTTATSDIRLKENIQTLQDGLYKVLQLRGVSFTWINHPEYGQRIGFIAQEMEKVVPELVFTNEVDGFKGINYAELTAVLTEAIKEQQAKIDRLQQENLDLGTRLERLEKALEELMIDD